jgi:hypothetical protein
VVVEVAPSSIVFCATDEGICDNCASIETSC